MFLNTERGQIFYEIDEPTSPVANLIIGHGLGGSANEVHILELGREIAKHGIRVIRMDFGNNLGRSYGRWEDTDPRQSVEDISDVIKHVKQAYPGEPLFVLGHSLGGLIVSRAPLTSLGVAGVILLSPVYSMIKIFEREYTLAYKAWGKSGRLRRHGPTGRSYNLGPQFKHGLEDVERSAPQQLPSLVVVGGLESHLLREDAKRYHDELADSSYIFLPNAHHDYFPHKSGDPVVLPSIAAIIGNWVRVNS